MHKFDSVIARLRKFKDACAYFPKLAFQFKQVGEEIYVYGLFMPAVSKASNCPKLNRNDSQVLRKYHDFLSELHHIACVYGVRINLAMWRSTPYDVEIWKYGYHSALMHETSDGTPIEVKSGYKLFVVGVNDSSRQAKSRGEHNGTKAREVQTTTVIGACEESHTVEGSKDRRVETTYGGAEAHSAAETDAAECCSAASKDSVKQQGYVDEGHTGERSTNDEGER